MTDIVLDHSTLLHMAHALRARHAVLDCGGTLAKANEAFEARMWMPYDPKNTITPLEEHPELNDLLIEWLETRSAETFDKFEFLRRLTAFDCTALFFEDEFNAARKSES